MDSDVDLAIQITTSAIYIALLIYLLIIFTKKLLNTKMQFSTDFLLLGIQLYGIVEGVIWNIYKFTIDDTTYHVLQALDTVYFIELFVLEIQVSKKLKPITELSDRYYNISQIVVFVAGIALTGGNFFGTTTNNTIWRWQQASYIYYFGMIIELVAKNLLLWFKFKLLYYNSSEFGKVLNYDLLQQFQKALSNLANFVIIMLTVGTVVVVLNFCLKDWFLQLQFRVMVRCFLIIFVICLTKYDEEIKRMNFSKLKRRMTNLKKIDIMNDMDLTDGDEKKPLVNGLKTLPLKNSDFDILPSKPTKVHFSRELAIIIHFDQNNNPCGTQWQSLSIVFFAIIFVNLVCKNVYIYSKFYSLYYNSTEFGKALTFQLFKRFKKAFSKLKTILFLIMIVIIVFTVRKKVLNNTDDMFEFTDAQLEMLIRWKMENLRKIHIENTSMQNESSINSNDCNAVESTPLVSQTTENWLIAENVHNVDKVCTEAPETNSTLQVITNEQEKSTLEDWENTPEMFPSTQPKSNLKSIEPLPKHIFDKAQQLYMSETSLVGRHSRSPSCLPPIKSSRRCSKVSFSSNIATKILFDEKNKPFMVQIVQESIQTPLESANTINMKTVEPMQLESG
ncbi:hypothetical protein HDV06_002499 [Boothiomyces sp. JEL0866]|nr:hypothetical protein HDV06_002499 [Boothiomyces sp. JEL0866]